MNHARDFSTDVCNSALIVTTKYSLRIVLTTPNGETTTRILSSRLVHLGGNAMSRRKISRRQFVAATALSSAALISAPYMRTAYAAGKVSMGFWDHWVPGANTTCTALVNEWAEKEKVEVSIDYITSQGNKNIVTIEAEAQAGSGHDIFALPTWWPHAHADQLEPATSWSRSSSRTAK
jgi:hypothetical protein